jgi:ABC-2 type transport system permease protein
VWILSLGVVLLASVASIVGLYGTEAERVQYAVAVAPSVIARAFEGPIFGTSLGADPDDRDLRHARGAGRDHEPPGRRAAHRLEEETGRAELVGSAVVGRHAPLTAALLLTFAANLAVGALTVLILLAYDLPVAGSLLAGLLLMSVGWSFAGIAAITAQVSASARGANGMAGAVVGVAYFLRAVGDGLGEVAASGVEVTSAWPSWLSPIGWGQQGRAFAGDRWWVLALFAVLVVATIAVAFTLTRHRDVGVGMRPVRAGPATASAALRSPLGLAWRLQRGSVLGWSVGLVLAAAVFGAIGDEVDAFLETSEELVELFAQLGGSEVLVDLFIVFLMGCWRWRSVPSPSRVCSACAARSSGSGRAAAVDRGGAHTLDGQPPRRRGGRQRRDAAGDRAGRWGRLRAGDGGVGRPVLGLGARRGGRGAGRAGCWRRWWSPRSGCYRGGPWRSGGARWASAW